MESAISRSKEYVSIYLVRLGLSNYYDYRTSNIQTQLDGLQKQRDATIEKLKTATKFNSTQELLKKYGGTPTPKAKSAEASVRKITPKHKGPSEGSRTSFVPPPTANIPGRDGPPSLYTSPQASAPQARKPPGQQIVMLPEHSPRPSQAPVSPIDHSAEFAPNAFSAPVQYAQDNEGPRWYDRLMDVLLGEDETRPGARLALICSQCRLVNGQAPPGVKILEDLGKWRCGGCGAMNGEESEVKKIVSSIKIASKEDAPSEKESGGSGVPKSHNKNGDDGFTPATEDQESDVTQYSTDESEKEEKHEKTELKRDRTLSVAEHDTPRRRSTRHTKGKKAG